MWLFLQCLGPKRAEGDNIMANYYFLPLHFRQSKVYMAYMPLKSPAGDGLLGNGQLGRGFPLNLKTTLNSLCKNLLLLYKKTYIYIYMSNILIYIHNRGWNHKCSVSFCKAAEAENGLSWPCRCILRSPAYAMKPSPVRQRGCVLHSTYFKPFGDLWTSGAFDEGRWGAWSYLKGLNW